MREGVAGATAAQAACTGRARLKAVGARARAERTANMDCMFVTLDMLKLSAWLNAVAYCRVVERAGMRCGKRSSPGGVRALSGGEGGLHGEGPTQGCGSQGTRGAHLEHAAHGRDLGRVEAERLVERRRKLPSRKGRYAMWEKVRRGRREGVGWRRRKRHVHREGSDSRLGGQGTRGAHREHASHGRDIGRVEAERLVERRRDLPSKGGHATREAVHGAGGVRVLGVAATQAVCTKRARLKAGGAGHARSARGTFGTWS